MYNVTIRHTVTVGYRRRVVSLHRPDLTPSTPAMDANAQIGSTAVTGIEDRQVTPSITETTPTFLTTYLAKAVKKPSKTVAQTVDEVLTKGSIYRVKDINLVPAPRNKKQYMQDIKCGTLRPLERQIWTMVNVASGEVSTVWAPEELSKYSANNRRVLKTGVIPILECITFRYKGYTGSSRGNKRYRFLLDTEVGDVRQRAEALIYFARRFNVAHTVGRR